MTSLGAHVRERNVSREIFLNYSETSASIGDFRLVGVARPREAMEHVFPVAHAVLHGLRGRASRAPLLASHSGDNRREKIRTLSTPLTCDVELIFNPRCTLEAPFLKTDQSAKYGQQSMAYRIVEDMG